MAGGGYDAPLLAQTAVGRVVMNAIAGQLAHGRELTREWIAHEVVRSLYAVGLCGPSGDAENVVRMATPTRLRLVHEAAGESEKSDQVVELLQTALTDARRGSLTFVALAGVGADGSMRPAWGGEFEPVTCLAAVTDLRIRFEAEYLEAPGGGNAA